MLDGVTPIRRVRRTKPSPNVLKVDWKLPARLRKPVRQQLASERKRKRAKILSGFARRPLTTRKIVEDLPAGQAGVPVDPVDTLWGVERHTGDMYRESKPSLRLVAPPYTGAAMKQALHGARSREKKIELVRQNEARGVVEKPKRRLELPFNINILPRGLFSDTRLRQGNKEPKKKVSRLSSNLIILLIGCLLAAGLVWNLEKVGRAWPVLAKLEEQVHQALGHIGGAKAALAESDFAAGEEAFADARLLLTQAQSTLNESLSVSQQILQVVDVTGTVRSGEALLTAGGQLTSAGEAVSRALGQLVQDAPNGVVAAIQATRGDLQGAIEQLTAAEENLAKVHSTFLPDEVRSAAGQLQDSVPRVRELLTRFVNQSDTLLTVLGAEREREYLVLFANNHELRPAGGFLGSLGLLSIDRGVVEAIDVHTVYDGDGQLKDFIAPPDPLSGIVGRWYLRDSNWFVDFPVSARKAADFFEKEGGPTVDGVILFTPKVIQSLLAVTGPIEMPAYGVTVSAENFTEVTQREVTYEYDRALNRPKQFLADLTPVLLNRLLSQRQGQGQGLLSALTQNLTQKNILLFFRDADLEKQIVGLGWGGAVPRGKENFLYVNNANIGGHKSDQFVEQEIDYRLEVQADGETEAVVTIRRTHHGPAEALPYSYPSGEDPAQKDNVTYQRVLVPEGSQLVEARGFTAAAEVPRLVDRDSALNLVADADVAEWQRGQVRGQAGTAIGHEAGYTFFANWVITKPGQTTVGLYRYRLPEKLTMPSVLRTAGRLAAYVAKQPGAMRGSVRVSIRLPEAMKIVATAPGSGVTQVSSQEFVYRSDLTTDVATGAVFAATIEP